jgi:tetratricopeptide (TPR) repeat protein
MYLRGSKFNMTRRRRNSNPIFILALLALIGGMVYVNMVVVPATPPLFVPTNTPTRAPITFIREAEDLVSQGKLPQAMAAYKQAILADPKNSTIYITLAQMQIFAGDYKGALDNAQNALVLNSNNSMAYAIRGWALGYQNDFLGAQGAIEKAIGLDANNGIAYAYLAEVLALQYQAGKDTLGLVQKATDASRTAQNLAPNTLETHRARGIVLEITQNYEEAAHEFEAAVAINPNISDLHLALGRNYRALAQYTKAVEEFNRAIALNPADPLPNTYIARTYLTIGDFPMAIQYAQQAVKVSPNDPYMYGNLGTMYYTNHQYHEALDPFKLAVRGGTTSEGVAVQGLAFDSGNDRIVEYYRFYGLAAAHANQCSDALPMAQYLQQNAPDNEYAVDNAKTMIDICKQNVNGTSTPTTAASSSQPKVTPAPAKK